MKKYSLMIKIMLTNITLIVNEWQHSNFRKALTRNFTQPLTLSALSSMITSNTVTCWQKAVKHLQWRIKNISVYFFEKRSYKITKLCKKKFWSQINIYVYFPKKFRHVTAVSLTHLSFFNFMFSPRFFFFLAKIVKEIHSRVAWISNNLTLSWNTYTIDRTFYR